MNSSNLSARSRKGSSESRLPFFFFFCFWFSGPQFPNACSSLRSVSGIVDDELCNDDVEDDRVPLLEDTPGTTRGTKLSVSHIFFFLFLANRGC